MTGVVLEAWQDWACPECHLSERTRPRPNRWHNCARLNGLIAPLVLAGTDAKLVAVERGDYLRGATQRTDDTGRPHMAVVTEHADGHTDALVFPEVATAHLGR
jgi:hypothetical protein